MPFTNDIVLVYEARSRVNNKLEIWQETLESKGFRLSETITRYIECKYSKNKNKNWFLSSQATPPTKPNPLSFYIPNPLNFKNFTPKLILFIIEK